jgi:hypothetical protein
VERRVEDGDVRDVRQRALRLFDCVEGRRVVQWRERRELPDRRLDLFVDDNRLDEPCPAVDDPVTGRVAADRERFDGAGLLAVDEVQLQARRARVDY